MSPKDVARAATQEVYFYVAGVQHSAFKTVALDMEEGDMLTCKQEPDNQYDPGAISLWYNEGVRVGYVPKKVNPQINKWLEEGVVTFTVHKLNLNVSPWQQLFVHVEAQKEAEQEGNDTDEADMP